MAMTNQSARGDVATLIGTIARLIHTSETKVDAAGNHPSEEVTVACALHRNPGQISGVELSEGQSLLASHVSHLFDGEARSTIADHPPASQASATDALTAAMFDTSIKLRPTTKNGVSASEPAAVAPTEVVLHGAETIAAGGFEEVSSGDEA